MTETQKTPWPHAPTHRLADTGTYMITAATLQHAHVFRRVGLLDLLMHELHTLAVQYGWALEAWAVFSNHYHFVGKSDSDKKARTCFFRHLHANTARAANRADGTQGRKVWHNFWDSELTFQKSYLARLHYVHQNAVRHGLTEVANQYRWCSAAWFERTASPAQVSTIYGMPIDKVNESDPFDPVMPVNE